MRLRALGGLAAIVYAGCASTAETLPPLGQVLLYVDTDAPVPAAPGKTLSVDEPAGLFDTLSIEVFEPGATTPCTGCTREFAVDVDKLKGGLSLGIPARPGVAGYRVRARLFQAAWVTRCSPEGESTGLHPRPEVTLTMHAALPAVGADGIVERSVFLGVDSLGAAQGTLDAPVETLAGRPESSKVGSWAGARRVPCNGAPRADEVCVPGGAFWMGHPRLRTDCGSTESSAFLVPRLVVLSPFFLQKTEVNVAAYRAAGPVPSTEVVRFSGDYRASGAGGIPNARCTYTDAPGPHESAPVNCVVWPQADAFCKKRGGSLPAEAQFEFVAGALTSRYRVWGDDEPTCEDSVWGRPWGAVAPDSPCAKSYLLESGPRPVDSAEPGLHRRLDRFELPTGTVFDLMGNLMEFQADTYAGPNDPCWSGTGILRDPLCVSASTASRSARGSSWQWPAGVAAGRSGLPVREWFTSTGFRCARPGI